MDSTIVRVIAGVLFALILGLVVLRRRSRAR
ncbi:MAG TPA: LPXTG cell wall anchor domain-containing protein [Terracidiphilus sp.]|jgi:LPXTG-motif cell wall-anchored protein|nr:LPXTG cell wall anchor domain-containing protein [Terracidiphilus sp.]